jgi:hypothetical protein
VARGAAVDDDQRFRQLSQGTLSRPAFCALTLTTNRFLPQQWLFDSPSAAPRLLKQRSGHHAPPHLVRYYGDDGKAILTAGADHALRYTSIVRDSRGYELSQGGSCFWRCEDLATDSSFERVYQDLSPRRPTISA